MAPIHRVKKSCKHLLNQKRAKNYKERKNYEGFKMYNASKKVNQIKCDNFFKKIMFNVFREINF